MPETPIATTPAVSLPSTVPTILSSAVATMLNTTPQSPMTVQPVQRLAVGVPPPAPVQRHRSRLPWVLSGAGVLGLGVVGYFLLRKKRR